MKSNRPGLAFVMILGILAAAPTVGDIGGCGSNAEALDAKLFFEARLADECARCQQCGYATTQCKRACDPNTVVSLRFPEGCRPTVHDGEVCLRAIEALSCSAFLDVVDKEPIVPTECEFCPPNTGPAPTK